MKSNTMIGIVGSGFLLLLSASMAAENRPGVDNSPAEDNSRIQAGFDYAREQHIPDLGMRLDIGQRGIHIAV